MFWFIIALISVLISGTLLFCSHEQKIDRKKNYNFWKDYEWEDVSSERFKFPLWAVLVLLIISLTPVLNLILIPIIVIVYIIQLLREDDADGIKTTDRRIVVRCKWVDWLLKFLNKKI